MIKKIFIPVVLVAILVSSVFYFSKDGDDVALETLTPTSSPQESIGVSPSVSPSSSPRTSKVPLPTGDGRTTFYGEPVPWNLLLADASCTLNGESLLSVVLPDNPKSKRYELTAKIQYGRLVDGKGKFVTAGGYVKVFEKQCDGKTVVVLP